MKAAEVAVEISAAAGSGEAGHAGSGEAGGESTAPHLQNTIVGRSFTGELQSPLPQRALRPSAPMSQQLLLTMQECVRVNEQLQKGIANSRSDLRHRS